MIVNSDIRTIKGYNEVGNVRISYRVEYRTDSEPGQVIGNMEKNGERIGTISVMRDGSTYINFDKNTGLTTSEMAEVTATVLSDADSVFNPASEASETTETTTE